MRVCVTGATGFIGRALIPVLRREGHTVVAWVRSGARARNLLGAEIEIVEAGEGIEALSRVVARCDAVINLAGEPILGGRWTRARRAVLRNSRVQTTRALVQAIAAARPRPLVLISGSAVGYYGDRGTERLGESSAPGSDFLSQLCQAWEAAARDVEGLGVRLVILRTGVVLGRDGGALAPMLLPFKLGVGGPVGSGRQYFPWIHLHDLVGIIATALVDDRYRGAINGVAPEEATSRQFAAALGRALHRPSVIPVPAVALRIIFGEAATVLLGSQRADAGVLTARGFSYAFPTLDAALADILGGAPVSLDALTSPPDSRGNISSRHYLDARRPTHELRATTVIDRPLDETFAFFSRADNLGMITPAAMQFAILGKAPAISEGAAIDYRVRVGPLTLRWRTRIVSWEPGARFVDLQEKGPYASWWHEHSFRADGTRTVMEDRVCYAAPFGPLGRLANRLFIAPTLRSIFQYRGDVIRLRFGSPLGSPAR
jgi:uncharacterized protein (TIGR01777 family)